MVVHHHFGIKVQPAVNGFTAKSVTTFISQFQATYPLNREPHPCTQLGPFWVRVTSLTVTRLHRILDRLACHPNTVPITAWLHEQILYSIMTNKRK